MAEFLVNHPKISNIRYPGLPQDPDHSIAVKQMKNGFGGVLAFDVGTSQEDAKAFISALDVIYHAVSLGSTETLICIPYLTTMLYLPPERRTIFGVNLNTVRLSAGIEPIDDLLKDLDQALSKIL
jgi:cystathionine beta-lyase/cystathionine gamma-synthase